MIPFSLYFFVGLVLTVSFLEHRSRSHDAVILRPQIVAGFAEPIPDCDCGSLPRLEGSAHSAEVALSHLMRILTRRLVAVLRSGKPYQPNYIQNAA
jgi:hypothetical protein